MYQNLSKCDYPSSFFYFNFKPNTISTRTCSYFSADIKKKNFENIFTVIVTKENGWQNKKMKKLKYHSIENMIFVFVQVLQIPNLRLRLEICMQSANNICSCEIHTPHIKEQKYQHLRLRFQYIYRLLKRVNICHCGCKTHTIYAKC